MLPNWLYGKSKSKLTSILGGGGGTPVDYEQVKAQVTQNAEDIDLLSDALDDKAALTQLSNPNIFHNPWFMVNQRAVTSATQNADYIADRWMVYFGENNVTIARNSNGNIVMDNTLGTTNITIYQKRTQAYLNSLVGKKLTASMMLSDGTIYSGAITYTGTGNPVYFENDYVKAHAPVLTANQIITFSVKPGASVIIKALKLEVGSVSTLAMDPRPEYALELAKCQRYFQRYARKSGQSAAYLGMFYRDSSTANIVIDLPANMRTTPTITLTSALNVEVASGSKEVSAIGSVTPNEACNKLKLTSLTMESQTAGTVGIVTLTGDNYIDFDAEL